MLQLKRALQSLGAEISNFNNIGDDWAIDGVQTLPRANGSQLSFCHNDKYTKQLAQTRAGYVIILPKYENFVPIGCRAIICNNAYYMVARVMQLLYPTPTIDSHYIDPTAHISANAIIHQPCHIGPGVVIGDAVVIGKNCHIKPYCVIEEGCILGEGNRIEPHCTIQHTSMGNNNYIHAGVRLGGRGFGFASTREGHWDIPQIGRVNIGNHCEIGANSCIDRGALEDTILADHVRIDAMVMVGHGAQIGFGSIIAGQGGVAGSARIGKFVVIAAQSGVAGHIDIADFTQLAAKSGITAPTNIGDKLGGMPAYNIQTYLKNSVKLRKGL